MKYNISKFSVQVYGKFEKYNDVLSKARCRIFYKYDNRNGTYITDEFADELLSTISYVPIKGIYEAESGDYSDHGKTNSEGKIYGVVPENPNLAWEDFQDSDGITRTYACVDVLIYTSLYEEALKIVGKSQSMELYIKTLEAHEEIINGQKYIVFDHGCCIGLQVLGDDTEPCFEGAAFYALQEKVEKLFEKIDELANNQNQKNKEKKMSIKFKLSDDQKFMKLWTLLNPEPENGEEYCISYCIQDVYDDYALVYNYELEQYERVYYTKDDSNDTVEITQKEKAFILDLNENEMEVVNGLRTLNGDTYELISETLTNAQENFEKISEFNVKIEELDNTISTLNTDKAEFEAQITALTDELDGLKNYKEAQENSEKENIINEYTGQLSEEVIESYKSKMNEYTAIELDKELAYELKKTGIFSNHNTDNSNGEVPKPESLSGLEAVLEKYKKK